MRAIAIREFGGRDRLQLVDLDKPVPETDDVLVRVVAAGVNPVDWKIREGWLQEKFPHRFPLIPGWDVAGIVEETGPGVTGFEPGDGVYAYCRKPVVQGGAYAEYVTVPAKAVAPKPRTLCFEEAAGVPLAALTAFQAIVDAGGVKCGDSVLVQGASGGVGSFAVQFAADLGAEVLGVASAWNRDYLASRGVRHPIDYRADDVAKVVRDLCPGGVDVIFDCVGGNVLTASAALLKDGGRLVSILDPGTLDSLRGRGIDASYVFVEPDACQLRHIGEMIDAGRVRTYLSAVLPLEEAARAHERVESQHVRGKIVLRVGTP